MSETTIRRATAADTDEFAAVLSAAFGVPYRQPLIHTWVGTLPDGHTFVAEQDGRIIATGASVGFGDTGWIGAIAVHPDGRGQKLGTRMTEVAIEALGRRETLLLLASPDGRPIYEGMGFVADGAYRVFSGPAHAKPAPNPGVREAGSEDYAGIHALDALATGEDRGSVIDASLDGALVADGGFALNPPSFARPIIATDPDAGRALLAATIQPGLRLAAPQANTAAVAAFIQHGCEERHGVERMRLGAPVAWRPELIWGVFSLFFG